MIQYLRDILELLKGSGSSMIAAFGLTAISIVLDLLCMLLLPWYLLTLQSSALTTNVTRLASAWLPQLPLFWLTLLVAIVLIARGAFLMIQSSRLVHAAEKAKRILAERLAFHYMTAPFEMILNTPFSRMAVAIESYTESFAKLVALPLLTLVLEALTIVGILAFVSIADPIVVPFFAGVLLFAGLSYYYSVRGASERHGRDAAIGQALFHHHMNYFLRTPREVRLLGLQDYFADRIGEGLRSIGQAHASQAAIRVFPRAISELTIIAVALAYMTYKTSNGTDQAVVLAQFSVLAFAALRILPAFVNAMVSVASLRGGRYAARLLLAELRQTSPVHRLSVQSAQRAPLFESLEFRDVSFQYRGSQNRTLTSVNLYVRRGQSVGVMGPSGSGKSTLGDLILGFLTPTSGFILVNGKPVSLESRNWWNVVGFVPQSVNLADDTLLRNIAFGLPDTQIDRSHVEYVAEMAQLSDVVRALPQGLNTLVGDQGVKLSGGQRQRVAIARALYHERQFLVLDEATSALDSQTEQDVVRAVALLRSKITTFIIAHRRSTLEGCDSIIELHAGCGVQGVKQSRR